MMNRTDQRIGGGDEDLVTQHLRSWSLHVTSWIDQHAFKVHVVRYEDLLASPAIAFRNVLTFLGWNPARRRVEHAVEQTRLARLARREADDGFAERSRHHGTVMQRLGYDVPNRCP